VYAKCQERFEQKRQAWLEDMEVTAAYPPCYLFRGPCEVSRVLCCRLVLLEPFRVHLCCKLASIWASIACVGAQH
jgi:hypothetical protein